MILVHNSQSGTACYLSTQLCAAKCCQQLHLLGIVIIPNTDTMLVVHITTDFFFPTLAANVVTITLPKTKCHSTEGGCVQQCTTTTTIQEGIGFSQKRF